MVLTLGVSIRYSTVNETTSDYSKISNKIEDPTGSSDSSKPALN